ncbi:hypothetical protein EV121DRAFT_292653 [Schizophyllum commune]
MFASSNPSSMSNTAPPFSAPSAPDNVAQQQYQAYCHQMALMSQLSPQLQMPANLMASMMPGQMPQTGASPWLNFAMLDNGQEHQQTMPTITTAPAAAPSPPPGRRIMEDIVNHHKSAPVRRTQSGDMPVFSSENDMLGFLREKIHELMRTTIGLAARGPWGPLPHPLPPGARHRLAPDNETTLFNPNFAAGVSDTVNAEWIDHVASVLSELYPSVVANVKHRQLRALMRTYLKTMRDKYKEQNTEQGRARALTKRIYNKRRSRRSDKAARRREQIPAFVEVHRGQGGIDDCVGIKDIIDTDYMSSEHSDVGNASKADWDSRRRKFGGGASALEVRKPRWRSKNFNKLLGALDTLSRGEETKKKAAGDSHGRRLGGPHYSRFPGHRANASDRNPPLLHGLLPLMGTVNRDWVIAQHKEATLQMRQDPPTYTIFSAGIVSIGDEELDEDAKAYLADDEEDGVFEEDVN